MEVAPDEAHPDACFTQDPAIVLEGQALLGRFGALSSELDANVLFLTVMATQMPFVGRG